MEWKTFISDILPKNVNSKKVSEADLLLQVKIMKFIRILEATELLSFATSNSSVMFWLNEYLLKSYKPILDFWRLLMKLRKKINCTPLKI